MNQAWPTKRLADVCQILGGATPSKKNAKFYGGDIPWATVGDMNVEEITATEEYITKVAVADCSTNVIPSGSIVMATRVGLGKVCVLGQDTAINQDLKGLTPKNPKELTNRWLYWWLKSKASDIQKAGTGATVQGVKMIFVQELEIPLPPLAEQKRIVALLDEAFAGIDEAMAKAEGLELKSKELRASVLSRLLEPTEVNTKARWSDRSLGEVCDILDYMRRPVTKADRRAGPYPYYGATGVQDYVDQFIFDEPLVLLGEDGAKWKSGDRSAFLVSGKTWVNNHAHVLRPNREIIADEWLVYWLNHSDLTDFITGVTVPKLNQGNMVKIPVPLPPLDEQRRIVALLDKAFAGTGELSSHASRKMSELSELKSSLLSQAFAGELTA